MPINLLYKWDIQNKVRILAGLGPYIAKNLSGTEKGFYKADSISNGIPVTFTGEINNKVEFTTSGRSSAVQGVTKVLPFDIGMDVQSRI